METVFGVPAHPLVVHAPVVLLPLAAVGVAVMLIRHAWYERYKWAVLAIGALGTLGAILATSTGEELEDTIGERVGSHAGDGELARTVAIVFFVALAAYVLVPWFLERRADRTETPDADATGPSWLRPTLMVVVALTALATVVTIVDAGHSGASKVWEDSGTDDRD